MAPVVRSAYRTLLPAATREFLWTARTTGLGSAVREQLVRRRLAAGRNLATARADGFEFAVDLRDEGVGRPLFVYHDFGRAEAVAMRRFIRPGDTVADVGANIGVLSCAAARSVGPTGRVVAVEPDPENFDLLCRNVRTNAPGVVVPVRAAATDRPGTLTLYRSGENFGDHRAYGGNAEGREAVLVRAATLDELVPGGCEFLKLDIQGYEQAALRGAPKLLANPRLRAVLAEFWPIGITAAGGDPAETFGLLAGGGRMAHVLEPDGSATPTDLSGALGRIAAKARPDEPEGAFVNLLFIRP